MQLIVNQQPCEFATDQVDVSTLLANRGIKPETVALAVNGHVIPRRTWTTVRFSEGDRVELVKVVAGGEWDEDPLVIAGRTFNSRLLMGTGRFQSPALLRAALEVSGTEIVTVAIRMTGVDGSGPDAGILSALDRTRYQLLPNTAGATSVRQAVFMAELAREALDTDWVKLEVIGDERTLWPDVAGTVEATRILVDEGFVVLPYTTTDLVTALRLEQAGAATVMPLGSMIGSGQGVQDWDGIRRIAERVNVPVVCDAGIGTPSDAVRAMEAGAAACLINTAISRSDDPPVMARAMRLAVEAGRLGYRAGRMPRSELAIPSSPVEGLVGTAL
ncbi:MAG: sulfur carrier protein ThiS [Chloroflexi bacterium]|nr:sulfur carrier protein ThiS [Chloroflexota bacterium]